MGTLHITLFTYRTLVYLTAIDIKNAKTLTKIHFQSVFTNNSIKNYFFLKKVSPTNTDWIHRVSILVKIKSLNFTLSLTDLCSTDLRHHTVT